MRVSVTSDCKVSPLKPNSSSGPSSSSAKIKPSSTPKKSIPNKALTQRAAHKLRPVEDKTLQEAPTRRLDQCPRCSFECLPRPQSAPPLLHPVTSPYLVIPARLPHIAQGYIPGLRAHSRTPALALHDFGFGPTPLFGWASVTPHAHEYGQPKYPRFTKYDYRRFCVPVGKAEVPFGRAWGVPWRMEPVWGEWR